MKVHLPWQLPLCAVLLLTINACEDRSMETKADSTEAPVVAMEQISADRKSEANLTTADTAMAAAMPGFAGDEYKTEEQQEPSPKKIPQQQPGQGQQPPPSPTNQQAPAPNVDWDKKIIKHGTLSVEVGDYAKFNDLVHNAVKQLGGYVANEEQNESDYKIENALTIKVPVAQFDNAIQSLAPGKEKILVKKITAQDVTGEVVDTKSRLEAKREVRLRYLELLRQAKKMEDILQVQEEINEIQENIEAAAGRVHYLTHSAAYSTIELSYFQVIDPKAKDKETPPGFGEKVLLALTAGLAWVGELLIVLLTLWPLWAAIAVLWWVFRKYRLSKRITAAILPAKGQPVAVANPPASAGNQPAPGAGQES
ncbi:DUF4349 domain-containing protein [Paraflavitalea sp. CAU 1676]|uniref:DUF4349 domain-containing protein n=1 Tax=Paraflavitalea sp. CAU 1676 TaxID=3032598 RepID=UPI0023DCB1A8|nr:DUF4349 domain-containing protein [Paraflavitalea sp. CAU 1676]MDF2187870.1 DUF4349 domain-containing protein [Paraflavitalea sp. CAU 1676]